MKNWKSVGSAFLKGLLCVALVAPMAVSCYDDTALWEEIEGIKGDIQKLQEQLNGQIKALNDLLEGGDITIAECVKNNDGSYQITLSNGTKFTVLPEGKTMTGLVSYMEINGVNYWAAYGPDGVLVPLKNSEGNNMPVSADVPRVELRDGVYYLVIGDEEFVTGYTEEDDVTIITDYTVNKDESGNIYSVTFTFGSEGLSFTVPMADYKGFSFRLGSAMAGSRVIKDLYVYPGESYQVIAGLDGVVDYVMQIPDGWRVKEEYDEAMNETYINITAPEKAVVEAGAAVASGDLKVVAVVEGGSAMVARLELTTEPFRTFTATATNAIIDNRTGVDKYLYGLSSFADFDEAAIFAGAADMLAANDKGVAESGINVALSELLGSELVPGEAYVLWAIPAFYEMEGENAGYYVREGLISKYSFGGSAVNVAVSEVLFNDAVIAVSLEGTDSYYGGTAVKSETLFDDILYRINNDMLEPYSEPLSYRGSAFSFPAEGANEGLAPVSETTYVTWVVPVKEEGNYTVDNIIYKEFTLSGVTAGGSLEVAAGEADIEKVSISVPLSSEGASRLYYAFVTSRTAGRYVDSEARAGYLLKNGDSVDASEVVAAEEGLDPKTTMVLFAMAVDENGKYGEVLVKEYTTEELVYNDLSVTVTASEVGQNIAKLSVTVSGGDAAGYVYWAGRDTEEFWLDHGKSKANVQQYLALYPDASEAQRAMYEYPLENGVLTMTNLKGEATYHVVVLAEDAEGRYSVAGSTQFTTLAVDLGDIVREGTDTWNVAKSQVEITWNQDSFRLPANSNMSAYYSFEIKCPTNLTAYILCMTEEYFAQNPDTQTVEDKIIDIEAQCSRKYDSGKVVYGADGQYATEPDWVDDNGETHTGTLLNVYDFYVHGFPTNGFATYFASGQHGEGNCTSWDNGACSNYQYALNHITKRHSVEYYKDYVKNTRGNYCTTQATIDRVAQDLFEAYYPYYQDAQPLIYENNGEALHMENHYAAGLDDEGLVLDDVFVVLKDADGNYYEPMKFEVPNYFK